ncbi:hypothetical protein Y032_0853g2694 [Ancylostoma ceylanicum]|uniref:Uncharacterized protein n=1 Tax=Ancylostoma ceylanicum TaxID=53326 RepID=A0A016WB45_9BILA|nr:hypothetical protein Y032_0853g2694 [Ancylostoma ceylanicum]
MSSETVSECHASISFKSTAKFREIEVLHFVTRAWLTDDPHGPTRPKMCGSSISHTVVNGLIGRRLVSLQN